MEALRAFVCSKTHEMLEDKEFGMTEFGAEALFEIWECEKITGNPRNSIYIRGNRVSEEMEFFLIYWNTMPIIKKRQQGMF